MAMAMTMTTMMILMMMMMMMALPPVYPLQVNLEAVGGRLTTLNRSKCIISTPAMMYYPHQVNLGCWRPPDHFKQVKMHYLNPCHDVLPPSSQFGLGELFPRLLGSLRTSFRGFLEAARPL